MVQGMLTTREIADLLGVPVWQVRRLFEGGELSEPPRFGGRRAVSSQLIPVIVDLLRRHDWLPGITPGGAELGRPNEVLPEILA